jgi:DNA helicase HerA-like ATPase
MQETVRRGTDRPLVTRIWRKSDVAPGCGALFHASVERFNALAASDPEILEALDAAGPPLELQRRLLGHFNARCLKLDALAERPVAMRIAFIEALQAYFAEMASVVVHARKAGSDAATVRDQLFGDRRKRVDVTFHVADDVQVHVTGAVDYVFYDARIGKHRIVDYKLTPATAPNNDLFQIYTYALMHHHQHGTRPDVAVFYLHPKRNVIEASWDMVREQQDRVYDLIASMVAWADDASGAAGLRPPGDIGYCAQCKHERSGACEKALGRKSDGQWDKRWMTLEQVRGGGPPAEAAQPPSETPEAVADEDPEVASAEQLLPDRAIENPSPTKVARARAGEVNGLLLGTTGGGAAVVVNPGVLRTHVAVVGAAGSGKTWMAKVVAEEALRAGIPVLAVDPQGDLVQMICARRADAVASELRALHGQFHARVAPRILTPGTSHGVRLSLDPLRLPSEEDLARIESPERRAEERQQLLGAVAANLVSLCAAGGEEESQRTFVYRILDLLPRTATVRMRDVINAIGDPEVVGLDQPDRIVRKAERERLARKLTAFVEGPSARLFEGGLRLDLTELLRSREDGRVPLNVIYLNALTDDDQKHFFLASLATEIYRWMITSLDATDSRMNLLFYIDEARDWIPAGGARPPAKQPLIRLFTQGRKYGVGCLLCTQSPRGVDYNVFGNTSTKLVGRLEAAQDIDRVVEWFANEGGAPPWVAARKGAEKGTFVGRWPDMPQQLVGEPFKGRTLFTVHEGAWSPDRVEREVRRSAE